MVAKRLQQLLILGVLLVSWGVVLPGPVQACPGESPPAGAHIVLSMSAARFRFWTQVQWQDTQGDWHNVDGWQGWLELDRRKEWFVAPKDFGSGPFRWTLFFEPGGSELAGASAPFFLPTEINQVVTVFVSP